MGGLGLAELKLSYLRRKRWEARLLAIEVVKALFGKSDDEDSDSVVISESGKRYQKVAAERFLNV